MNLLCDIKNLCYQASQHAFNVQDSNLCEVTKATQKAFGHYQCNTALKLSRTLKIQPKEIAQILVTSIEQQAQEHSYLSFKKIEISGPGFINLTLSNDCFKIIYQQILNMNELGIDRLKNAKKVVIDFSSPNIAKDMHVGHLRSTIIGDCLARLLEFKGFNVLRLNHIGDWGTQFGMLITFLKDKYDDYFNLKLENLVKIYQASKIKFDNDPEFKKRAQSAVVQLQNHDPELIQIWKDICNISKKDYHQIFDLLNVKIIDRGESFYNPMLADIIQLLEHKNLIKISEGAKCVYPEGFKNREGKNLPLIVQKSDGGYNYSTTDLAGIKHRIEKEKADWLIYVTDAGQSQHFDMVFATANMAGFYSKKKHRIDHIPFGLVLRSDGKKFKTRSGNNEKLIDLLYHAIDKAKKILQKKTPHLNPEDLDQRAKALGINAIKYSDLSCHRQSDYQFSYDKMLQFEGNTAAFINYAYARIRSIQQKNNKLKISLDELDLYDQHELDLAFQICQFPEILDQVIKDLLPHRLTDYLYKLAEQFHIFFHHCRVEGNLRQTARLTLCELTAQVIEKGFRLLGLTPIENM